MLDIVFTASDLDRFNDESLSVYPKLLTMAERMAKIGIMCPAEKTLQRGIALLVAIGKGEFAKAPPTRRRE
eukprot:43770-Pyramimonas_sp.AAC.1